MLKTFLRELLCETRNLPPDKRYSVSSSTMPRKRKTDADDVEVKQKRGRKKGANGANGDPSGGAARDAPFEEDNEVDNEEAEIVS